jgi:hypothetical protein
MNDEPVVQAIHDLTRVIIALQGGFGSQSEAVRRLDGLSIPAGRIAPILAMRVNDVSSIIAKQRKKSGPAKED